MGPLTLLLVAVAAGARPEPPAGAVRADADGVLGRITSGPHEGAMLVRAPPPQGVRLHRCADDTLPSRIALQPGPSGVLVHEGPWPAPVPAEGGWWLPPATDAPGTWAVRSSCDVDVRAVVTAGDRLDQLDLASRTADELATRRDAAGVWAEDDVRLAWLDVARELEVEDAMYTALRTASPLAPVAGSPRPQGAHRADADDDLPWAPVDDGERLSWRVVGPTRLVVVARGDPRGAQGEVRLTVQQDRLFATQARDADPSWRVDLVDGTPTEVGTVDGAPEGPRVAWHVWVPPGPADVHLEGASRARLDRIDTGITSRWGEPPTTLLIVPDAVPEDDPRVRRVRARPPVGTPAELLVGPSPWSASPRPDGISWVPLGTEDPRAARVDAETGRLQLMLTDAGTRCDLTLGDHAWTARGATGRVTVVVPPEVVDVAPRLSPGCEALVRTQADPDAPVVRRPDRHVGVLGVRLAPGQSVPFTFDRTPRGEVRVRAQLPAGRTVRLEARVGGGPWQIRDVRGDDATWIAADGTRWTPAASWTLEGVGRTVEVRADAPIRVRVDGIGRGGGRTDPGQRPPIEGARLWAQVLADAPNDLVRAEALRRRADALLAADRPRAALRDARLAEGLDPGDGTSDWSRAVVDHTLELWAPAHAAVPLGPWAPDVEAPSPVWAGLAGDDDIAVARAVGGRAAVPWWLRASRERTLTAEEALEAYAAFAALDITDAEAAGPVRAWSRWQRIEGVSGARRIRVAPPPPPVVDDAGLFVDPWLEARTVRLDGGARLRLPPAADTTSLSVRCHAVAPEGADAPCELRIEDATGGLLDAIDLSPWGAVRTLDLPPAARPRFLAGDTQGPTRFEILVPDDMGSVLPEEVDAWQATGRTATVVVRGPTAVRVVTWPAADGVVRFADRRVAVRDEGEGRGIARVDVPEGVHDVRVDLEAGAVFAVDVRVPRGRASEPTAHGPLLARLADPARHARVGDVAVPEAQVAPIPPPDDGLPLTVWTHASGAVGAAPEADPEEASARPGRGRQRVLLASRPTDLPLWFEVGGGIYEAIDRDPTAEVSGAVEAWWTPGPWRLFAIADGSYRAALRFTPLHTGRGRLRVGAGWRPRRVAELRVRVGIDTAVRDGPFDDVIAPVTDGVAWSRWRETHRFVGDGVAEVRLRPAPWVMARLWGGARTNAPDDTVSAIDLAEGGIDLRLGVPAVRAQVGFGIQQRFADRDRDVATTSPRLDLGVRGTLWLQRRLALRIGGDLRWEPSFAQRVTAGLGVDVIWSGRAGLPDLRPSRLDTRPTDTWFEPDRWLPTTTP